MRLIHDLKDADLTEESVVTIGSFDGLHRGHQALIADVRESALNSRRASVVVTVFPHPSVVLGQVQPFYLTSPEEKLVQINQTGVDLMAVLPFTRETAQIRAADFGDGLIEQRRVAGGGRDLAFPDGPIRPDPARWRSPLGRERGF